MTIKIFKIIIFILLYFIYLLLLLQNLKQKIISNKQEFEFTMEKEEDRVAVDYVRNNEDTNTLEICGRLSHTLKMKGKMRQQLSEKIRNKYMETEKNNKTYAFHIHFKSLIII